MPHLPIIVDWQEILDDLHEQSERIAEGMSNYTEGQAETAEQLLADTTSLMNSINSEHRTAADALVTSMESFPG